MQYAFILYIAGQQHIHTRFNPRKAQKEDG
jgi:hypothetical protein